MVSVVNMQDNDGYLTGNGHYRRDDKESYLDFYNNNGNTLDRLEQIRIGSGFLVKELFGTTNEDDNDECEAVDLRDARVTERSGISEKLESLIKMHNQLLWDNKSKQIKNINSIADVIYIFMFINSRSSIRLINPTKVEMLNGVLEVLTTPQDYQNSLDLFIGLVNEEDTFSWRMEGNRNSNVKIDYTIPKSFKDYTPNNSKLHHEIVTILKHSDVRMLFVIATLLKELNTTLPSEASIYLK